MQHKNDALIAKIYAGVKRLAIRQSRTYEQAQDFLQEGLICALEAIDRYKDKSETELILLISKAASNRIFAVQRSEVTFHFVHKVTELDDLDHYDDPFSEFEALNFYKVLRSRLPDNLGNILQERFDPSDKVIAIQQEEREEKLVAREGGQLVMNVHNDKINNNHIAKALGISKATISRGFTEIQQVAEALNRG